MERDGLFLEPEITNLIEKVGALDVPVTTCTGCIVREGLKGKDVIRAFVAGKNVDEKLIKSGNPANHHPSAKRRPE